MALALVATPAAANPITLNGWNQDIIAENTAASPFAGTSYHSICCTWVWYEHGAPETSQGLPTNGVIDSIYGQDLQFDLQSYTADNALLLTSGQSGTMTLTNPETLTELDLLLSTQGGATWSLTLNFADNSTYTFSGNSDPDWTSTAANVAAQNLGVVSPANSWSSATVYTGTLNMLENDFTLPVGDQSKVLDSFTVHMNSGGSFMLFAADDNYTSSSSSGSVPEPATLMLFGFGAGAIGMCARLRFRKRSTKAACQYP